MKATLKESLKTAMKNKDRLRMETIRSLLSEIQYEEMNKSVDELPANDTVVILQREMKKRQEAIGFEEQDFSELKYAKRVAEHVGAEYHEFIVRPNAPGSCKESINGHTAVVKHDGWP